MRVSAIPVFTCQPLKPCTEQPQKSNGQVSFGYKWYVKDLWREGKLPTVTKGIYGDVLSKENLSVEHLLPKSKGGKSSDLNFALASKRNNNARGNMPLVDFASKDTLLEYLEQFKGIFVKKGHRRFNGDKYADGIKKTVKKLGIDLEA